MNIAYNYYDTDGNLQTQTRTAPSAGSGQVNAAETDVYGYDLGEMKPAAGDRRELGRERLSGVLLVSGSRPSFAS